MTGFRTLSSGLRSLRPAAFGADPGGARMERMRRSPNFADGVFQNPESARTRPDGSMVEFAKVYFRKEDHQLVRPVFIVKGKDPKAMKNKEDFYEVVEAVAGAGLMQKPDAFGCKLGDYT